MEKPDKPQIVFSKSGPYKVCHVEKLEDEKGNLLPVRSTMVLCRCGRSAAMPFCDGKHTEHGFQNENTRGERKHKVFQYAGEEITVYFNPDICSHVAVCLKQLPSVFNLKRKPWIDPNGADVQSIINTVYACPSGALTYTLNKETMDLKRSREKKITMVTNGPYNVEGGIDLVGELDQKPVDQERYCLCSCGRTKNTPFCDGSHLFDNKLNHKD